MGRVTIRPCPNCRVLIKGGRIEWSCDDYHPEFFGLPPLVSDEEQQEQERTVEEEDRADVTAKEQQQEL